MIWLLEKSSSSLMKGKMSVSMGNLLLRVTLSLVIVTVALEASADIHNQQDSVSLNNSSDPCNPTLNLRESNYIDYFPGNLTNFDLDQFNYNLEVIISIGKDSWYDYIVIGAGVGGSVVANRLSEDPSARVLLLEAGGKEDPFTNIPFFRYVSQKSWRDYAYVSVPQKQCCQQFINNQIPIPRGKIIGGSSSINGVAYQRGSPEDFDRWDRIYGAKGWSFRDVFPYFIKSENVEPSRRLDPGYHGNQGPYPNGLIESSMTAQAILDGIAELGYPIGDFNGRDAVRTGTVQNAVRNGLRYSTGRAYLSRASVRPNLDILIFARADRILFDESLKKAIGVEYTANSEKSRVFARREIIISAGVIETPKLLMLSGIGPEDDLKSLGIPVIIDSPGVGRNLHEQPLVEFPFETLPDASSDNILQSIVKYVTRREGRLASPGYAINGFFRTKLAKDIRPDLELQIGTKLYGGLVPFDQTAWESNWRTKVKRSYYMPYEGKDGIDIMPLVTHPYSRGWIKLASRDPDQAPLIDYNLLADDRDIDVLVEGCKLTQQIIQTKSMKPLKPRFLGVVEQCKGLPLFSDEYFRCMIPIMTSKNNHPVGTAKMGPPTDRYSVIDPELRVYGVKGLRIADASVMPETISGHPMAAIIMIGERCADFIKGRHLRPILPPIHNEKEVLNYD